MSDADSAAGLQPKLIYLTRRNPRLSRAEFTPRWRQHGALGMSLPRWRNIARYVHGDVLRSSQPVIGLRDDFDGIGMIWHRSAAARRAHLADASSKAQMERDEAETFAAPIVSCCLVAREQILREPPREPSPEHVKLTRFWDADVASPAIANAIPGCLGHVIDWPLPPEQDSGWGLRSRAVEEIWFAGEAAALRAYAALRATTDIAESKFNCIDVLSRDVLLWQAEV